LDSYDYVYGSRAKLEALLEHIKQGDYELIAIINSPGAALIGDDLTGIAGEIIKDKQVLTIETPGFSENFSKGFQEGIIALLKGLKLSEGSGKERNRVNLLGVSIYNKYYQGDIEEIKRLLGFCGIEVNCVLCADTDLADIRHLPQASLNIVLYPELGLEIARYLEINQGMPFWVFEQGLPIGFQLTEQFIKQICSKLEQNQEPFQVELEKARLRAFMPISRLNSLTGLPRGATFAVEAPSSALLAYSKFLMGYFGLLPACLQLFEESPRLYEKELLGFLASYQLEGAYYRQIEETKSDLVLASGQRIAQLKLKKNLFSGIEISLPTLGYIDVLPRTHLGLAGSLLLCEQILNGVVTSQRVW
jgi:nitrogenase molybdenum-iron protein alpha/beta subunit